MTESLEGAVNKGNKEQERFFINGGELYERGRNGQAVHVGNVVYTDNEEREGLVFEYPSTPGVMPPVIAMISDGKITPIRRR